MEPGTWSDFIARHAATLWACDFFSVKTMTMTGIVEVYVLFFIHTGTRRVFIPNVTPHPDGAWVAQQARNFVMHLDATGQTITHLIRDLDSKYVRQFDTVIESEGAEIVRVGPRAPNLDACAERFVLSVKSECLDHFVLFGERHLRYLLSEYMSYFHECRPHQGLDNRPLGKTEDPPAILPFTAKKVKCRERLGGLLKSYYVEAA